MDKAVCFLLDNGSLGSDAVLGLREIAANLSIRAGRTIIPVSVAHSDNIPAHSLHNVPAFCFADLVEQYLRQGVQDFLIIPLFIAPSYSITGKIQGIFKKLSGDFKKAHLRVAPCLAGSDGVPDVRLCQMLVDGVQRLIEAHGMHMPAIAMVDHGSPRADVAAVRDAVAQQLAKGLQGRVTTVQACSMERRVGERYDFNEPLLSRVLGMPEFLRHPVIVAQLFISPGKHAGPHGDIHMICQEAQNKQPSLRVYRTKSIGAHPLILDVLFERLEQVCA